MNKNKLIITLCIISFISFFLWPFFIGCKDSIVSNLSISSDLDTNIYVIEKDHLFGGFGGVDNYHETLIINTSEDSICFTVESPLPDTLKHESLRSPAFGLNAIIQTPYQDYFDLPNIDNNFYTNTPDSTTNNSYFWKNLKLAPSDLMEIPYSNYYGDAGNIFVNKLGTSSFLYLDIISTYSIEKNANNPQYINIEIKETLQNITNDTLYRVSTHLFIPRELKLSPDYTTLYNLISDTIISINKLYLYNNAGTSEGFGFHAVGQEIESDKFILLPAQSFEFVFKMTIQPLLNKFEIYPSYGITYIRNDDIRIWPASIITVNNKKYAGEVNYLKECTFVLPTYILFSVNKDSLKVVSPDEIEPTFKPDIEKRG